MSSPGPFSPDNSGRPSEFWFFRDFRVIFIWLKMNKLRIKPGQKPEKGGGFRRSTAGGRELGLEARPPARLICWRKLFSTGKSGLLPGVWEGDGRCMSKDAGRRSRLCPRKNHPEIPEEAEIEVGSNVVQAGQSTCVPVSISSS